MNHDVLERLLIDRACGELSLDANALLNAYLEKEPAQAARAQNIEETVTLAKRAMRPPQETSLPPLKVSPFPAGRFDSRAPLRAAWPIGLAAAFLIGAALSAMFLRTQEPTANQPVVTATTTPQTEMPSSAPSGLWSAQRLMNVPRPALASAPRLIWTSPVRKPTLNNSL